MSRLSTGVPVTLRGMDQEQAKRAGALIAAKRKERGWSQRKLAEAVGIEQQSLQPIERGKTLQSKHLAKIAAVLDIPLATLDPALADIPDARPIIPGAELVGARDFKIFASAEGGSGQLIVTTDPVDFLPRPSPVQHVKDAYGLYISGESMFPEFEAGDIAIVNPRLPMVGDVTAVLYAERHGEARATIKRVRRWTADQWFLRQWNPPEGMKQDFTVSRKEWTICHRTVGKYSRR